MRLTTLTIVLSASMVAGAAAWPWSDVDAQNTTTQPAGAQEITASLGRQFFSPEFRRVYSGQIAPGITIKVLGESSWIMRRRSFSGQLKQEDGSSIDFDPRNVAAKVLKPELVPLVEDFCRKAEAMDRDYIEKADTIQDRDGHLWRLVPSS